MKDLARRGFLKALGVAPAASAAFVHAVKESALTGRLGNAVSGYTGGDVSAKSLAGASINKPVKYTSVAEWWEKFGEAELGRPQRHVSGFDPDLIEMRLPMATKVRIQRQRNYEYAKAEQWANMERRLSLNGFIEWWS